ncbi:uncharacterized protein PpBr36_09325 [Pyricularia pennisetigena]|uniref:uncharacterized protein n=1 Tax=Pyricularia pennisetigena TaxID=1578925 RepID=UPI00114F608D|nr:uncharacterized protein PpBr36_09325 [Pyricularia pennisetigena]TLS21832.1 hypothetical protein PpBr36_09325 [Pyricularia pennisetigena]
MASGLPCSAGRQLCVFLSCSLLSGSWPEPTARDLSSIVLISASTTVFGHGAQASDGDLVLPWCRLGNPGNGRDLEQQDSKHPGNNLATLMRGLLPLDPDTFGTYLSGLSLRLCGRRLSAQSRLSKAKKISTSFSGLWMLHMDLPAWISLKTRLLIAGYKAQKLYGSYCSMVLQDPLHQSQQCGNLYPGTQLSTRN